MGSGFTVASWCPLRMVLKDSRDLHVFKVFLLCFVCSSEEMLCRNPVLWLTFLITLVAILSLEGFASRMEPR